MSADQAIKQPVRVATTGNISLSGLATVDGVALSAGDRVLVRAQSSAVQNGIYDAASGAWSRSADFDSAGEAVGGTQVLVTSGAQNAGLAWRVAGAGAVTIGTSAINFERAYDGESVAVARAQAGTLTRSAEARLDELALTPQDFGAVADGAVSGSFLTGTDDSSALQAWLNAGAAGAPLRLPAGQYYHTASLSATVPAGARRMDIRGDGAANTALLYDGDRDQPALRLVGNAPADFDLLHVGGFRILLPNSVPSLIGTGPALRLENFRQFRVENMRTLRAGIGFHLIGCLVGEIADCVSYYDGRGIQLEQGAYNSGPNVISVRNCEIAASYSIGALVSAGTLVRFVDTTFESVGTESHSAIALSVSASGLAGAIGVICEGCYFEATEGFDVYLSHVDRPAVHRFNGCTFNRTTTGAVAASIVFDAAALSPGGAPAVLDVSGSAFAGYGAYTPSGGTPYIAFTNPNSWAGLTFVDLGTLYDDAVERPVVNALIARNPIDASGIKVDGTKVVGARDTGWTAGTGTANKGAFATFAGQTIANTYTKTQVQAIDDAAKANARRIKALEDALRGHGLIN